MTTIELETNAVGDQLEAVIDSFQQQYPNLSVTVTKATNPKLDVKTRILREQPPDVWTGWPGQSLYPYLDSGVVGDISHLWERNDWEQSYHELAIEAVRYDGIYRALPSGINRINLLYYNANLAEEIEINPETIRSPTELVDVLDQIDDTSIGTGMIQPMRDPWTVLTLFELVLLGEHGANVFNSIVDGNGRQHEREIRSAFEVTRSITEYATDDALYLPHTKANDRFVEGESVFFQQGSWAARKYMDPDGYEYGTDWDVMAFPGTEGEFLHNMNAFFVSPGMVEDENIERFLEHLGSRESQSQQTSGCGIPPRKDVQTGQFHPVITDQISEFEQSRSQPSSIIHGLGCRPQQLVELKSLMAQILADWDTDQAAKEIAEILDRTE